MVANPSAGGAVGPLSGFYAAGSNQNITATANPGYVFAGWTCVGAGCYGGANASSTVTMNNALTQTANFTLSGGVSVPIRVNAGSQVNYVDPLGHVWSADTGSSGGLTFTSSSPIANTNTAAPVSNRTVLVERQSAVSVSRSRGHLQCAPEIRRDLFHRGRAT